MTKNKENRKIGATSREEYNATLTVQQKIAKLDALLGKGVGAKRQRARYAKLLEAGGKAA